MYCLVLGLAVSSPEDLKSYIVTGDGGVSLCGICHAFSHKSKYDVQNHIESRHFPNSFVYTCPTCRKDVSTRKALVRHSASCSKL